MSDAIIEALINGVFTVVGGLIGAAIMWWKLSSSRKEKIHEEQLQALEKFATLTEVIRKECLQYLSSYKNSHLRLQSQDKSSDAATAELEKNLSQRIHDDGHVITTGQIMRVSFPDLTIDGKDWESISKEGQHAYKEFVESVHKSATGKNGIASDDPKNKLYAYINERQKIAATCRAKLVG
ncbi:MAG: hypothetical protein NPIRA05_21510 [Nitrospirales bacterium]|nr:MAG: hypothetical protein NPIRA05_21510 [Nitrospirales bacterium]